MMQSDLLRTIPGIVHGFGMRGIALDEYLRESGIDRGATFSTNQIHGNCVHHLHSRRGRELLEGDAFITDQPGVVCHVRTADCVPIIIVDASRKAVAAIHAGWRGTVCDVIGETMREMARIFGTKASDCVAAVGPRICGACYEVGDEVIEGLVSLGIGDSWRADESRVDLGAANRKLIIRAGIAPDNVEMLSYCTRCDERFASFRRDRSDTERQVNFVIILGK